MGVLLYYAAVSQHFASSNFDWVTIQAKNSKEMPLLALHLLKSCTEAITHVPQIISYTVKEKGMKHEGEQR